MARVRLKYSLLKEEGIFVCEVEGIFGRIICIGEEGSSISISCTGEAIGVVCSKEYV